MSQPKRSLVVVRHAKSDWSSGVPDDQRPLNARGRRDAPRIGRWLADRGLAVDAALVSPAARTRATWAHLASAADLDVRPEIVPRIYLGSVDDLAAVVGELDPAARCAVLVGHAPGCQQLVERLTGGRGDPAALLEMRTKYPTAAAALVEIDGEWADSVRGGGRLLAFEVCRG